MRNRICVCWRFLSNGCTIGLMFVLSGCTKRSESDHGSKRERATPAISDMVPSSPADSVKAEQPAFEQGDKPPSTDGMARARDERTRLMELYRLAHERTPAAVATMKEMLETNEKQLPARFPDLEGMKRLERNPPAGEHWSANIRWIMAVLRSLVLSDTAEGERAAQDFLRRFAERYADSETGRMLGEVFSREVKEGQADVKAGWAPWKRGIPEDRGQ